MREHRPRSSFALAHIGCGAAVAVVLIACRPAGMPTASGLRVTGVSYVESCALWHEDTVRRFEVPGDALVDVVPLLDETGVSRLPGGAYAAHKLYQCDGCAATLTVKLAGQPARKFDVEACYEPHVCAFLERAEGLDLLRRRFTTCDRRVPCRMHRDGWPI